MYKTGCGVPQQDYQKAMEWLRKAADQEYASPQYSIGLMYKSCQGVPQDYQKAMEWFRKAAEKGLSDAQCYIAVM